MVRGRTGVAGLALAVVVGLGAGLTSPAATATTASQSAGAPRDVATSAARTPKPPNVVLILVDDFSSNLLRTMPNTLKLKRQGAFFPNMIVADSLCCTSRSALFTGLYPHNNHVRMNTRGRPKSAGPPRGGWQAFRHYDNARKTFANAINHRREGRYRTGFSGKFLNGYRGKPGSRVPVGWSRWNPIVSGGYSEWGYRVTHTRKAHGHRIVTKGRRYTDRPKHYATRILKRRAIQFMGDGDPKRPFFLEVATYATHSRVGKKAHPNDPLFPPAPWDRPHPKRDKNHHGKDDHGNCGAVPCGRLRADRLPGFNNATRNNRPQYNSGRRAPRWQRNVKLDARDTRTATKRLRDRARMAQAVDRLVRSVRKKAPWNTYIIVTSDNGFHLGQHRSRRGKGTAYDYDVRVPMIVYKKALHKRNRITPGVRRRVVSNVDLAPTIRRMARMKMAERRNGVSLLKLIRRPHRLKGLRYAFVEHTKPNSSGPYARRDPDLRVGKGATSSVPSYVAVRSRNAVLIRYKVKSTGRHAWEYYRYHRGRKGGMVEKANTYHRHRKSTQVRNMKDALRAFDGCKPRVCRAARRLLGAS